MKAVKMMAVSAVLSLICTSCGSAPVITEQQQQVEISLSWWGNDSRHEYTLAGVEAFEKLHPDIRVNCSYSEWSGYESRSRVQMVSDTEADVMQINFGWLSEYSADGSGYYDLEKVSDVIDLSSYSDEMLEYGRKNGILNAVPIAMNAETVYINSSIYQKYNLSVPKHWDDFIDAARVMRKDGVYPIAGAEKSIWLFTISYAEQKTGKSFLKDDGSLNFSVNDLQIMLEFHKRMIDEKVYPQVKDFSRTCIENGTYAGAVAWVSDAVNYFKDVQQQGTVIEVAPYTTVEGMEPGEGWYAKPATMYAISRNTEHPKESAMLLDFLLNSSEMTVLQGVEKGIPLSTTARETLDRENMLQGIQYNASLCMEQNTELNQMNSFIENDSLIKKYTEACNLVVFDKATPEQAAAKLYADIKGK